MADAPALEDRGLRTSVALYCVRPDLIDGVTLEQIGVRGWGHPATPGHLSADPVRPFAV